MESKGFPKPTLDLPLLETFEDIDRLRSDVSILWSLLDEIATSDAMAKNDDNWFRNRVRMLQNRRFDQVISDGYHLYVNIKGTIK